MPSTKKKITPEKSSAVKKVADKNEEIKKGYNEKNPSQPQGAFKPDNAKTK